MIEKVSEMKKGATTAIVKMRKNELKLYRYDEVLHVGEYPPLVSWPLLFQTSEEIMRRIVA